MNVVVTYAPVRTEDGKEVFPAELFREPDWHWEDGAFWAKSGGKTIVIPLHRIWRIETVEGIPEGFVTPKEEKPAPKSKRKR